MNEQPEEIVMLMFEDIPTLIQDEMNKYARQ
jgi:hypothetical protein